jgi:PTH1 family peptidyl-tRNA hydrolase
LLAWYEMSGASVELVMPVTFMNDSGIAVKEVVKYRSIDLSRQLIVVHDELDLPVGQVRIKRDGGMAGHNGLRSIARAIGTKDFVRVRLGIGRPATKEMVVGYVLAEPPPAERDLLAIAVKRACDAIEDLIRYGLDKAMSLHNRRGQGE